MLRTKRRGQFLVEFLEGRIVPSTAVASGLAVESQGYHAVGQSASAHAVVGGGERFVETLQIASRKDNSATASTASSTDPFAQFAQDVDSQLAGGSTGVRVVSRGTTTTLSETILQDGYSYSEKVTIVARTVRGQTPDGSATTAAAFDALAQDVASVRTYSAPAGSTSTSTGSSGATTSTSGGSGTAVATTSYDPRSYGGGLGYGPNPGFASDASTAATSATTDTSGSGGEPSASGNTEGDGTGGTIGGTTVGGVIGTGSGTLGNGTLGGGSVSGGDSGVVGQVGGGTGTGLSGTDSTGSVVTQAGGATDSGNANTSGSAASTPLVYGPSSSTTVGTGLGGTTNNGVTGTTNGSSSTSTTNSTSTALTSGTTTTNSTSPASGSTLGSGLVFGPTAVGQ